MTIKEAVDFISKRGCRSFVVRDTTYPELSVVIQQKEALPLFNKTLSEMEE